jgi:peroxiredoxin
MSCQAELRGLGAINDDLAELGAKLVAISVDPPERSRELAKANRLPFSILSDEQMALIRAFGLLHRGGGPGGSDIALPAHVLLNTERQVRWKYVADRIHNRLSEDRVLQRVRDALSNDS